MLHIITACQSSQKLKYLSNSAKDALTVVDIPVWKGCDDTIYAATEFVANLPDDDIVCVINNYDSIVYADIEEIKARFVAYGTGIVFAAEDTAYPRIYEPLYNDLPETTTPAGSPYRFIHSGGYIGYVRALRTMFAWREPIEIWATCSWGGNQNFYTEYYISHARYASIVKLDSDNQIFHAAFRANVADVTIREGDGRFVCQWVVSASATETAPCIVHFNGFTTYELDSVAATITSPPNTTTALGDVLPPITET